MTSKKGRVLLVDDEEDLLRVGTVLLEALGFSVMTASNGKEALELYLDHAGVLDAIMMDLAMPEMGGMEAYRRLRSTSRDVSVILCSGYFNDEVEVEIEKDSHAGLLEKPYKASQLENILMKIGEKLNMNDQLSCIPPDDIP